MTQNNTHERKLLVSILSLSLLTVMAGAAVAPALGVISAHFAGSDPLFIQMIISIPAIFIVITNFFFPKLCRIFGARTLVMGGLALYTAGGCAAGAFDNIFMVLIMRALVGIGVGIIMPMSTGLLAYYFPPQQQERLMGYSSAMNQMGGVIATLLAGLLAGFSWRASFLVYLLGFFSIILCMAFLPNEKLDSRITTKENDRMKAAGYERDAQHDDVGSSVSVFKENYKYIIAMFLLMTIFFIYPANFAIETAAEGVIPQKYIAVIMAGMDFVAFFGGLLFVHVKGLCKSKTKFAAPLLFLAGYLLLAFLGGWAGILAGSVLIGFANGAGIPYIISEASKKAGKSAATTVMPLISAALYLAQFLCPVIMSVVAMIFGSAAVDHLPYCFAAVLSVVFFVWSGSLSAA